MKKSRFALMTALAALLTIGFIGCSEPESATTSGTDTPSQPETPVTPDVPGSTFQEQINNAKEGATVTLNASLASAGKELTITKALTVDANNIEGLSVTVSSDVANQVVFKNFKKAKFDIISPVNRSISRGDESPEGEGSFKKFGDEALSLKLEGCSIEELSTVSDLALFMGSGNDKSVIDSLILKKGAEDFTFIEFDESGTETADKSLVKDLTIEDGVKEINLIGGTFDDVNFAADFSDKVDFKYDKEFGDQLNFEDKEKFLEGDKVEAKDIALADDKVVENYQSTSGVFMFTMTKAEFEEVNGHFDIVFLTNEQAESWIGAAGEISDNTITFETPAYDMSIMGAFTVAKNENGELVDGLYAVYGGSKTYRDYRNPYSYRIRTLENYMTYSKEAVVVEVAGDTVNVYVNKGAIRKSDLLLCSGWRPADADENQTGTSEGGSKLSNINLEGYYPFFALNTQTGADFDVTSLFSTYNAKPLNAGPVLMPVSSKQEFIQDYYIYNVTDCGEYPDVSNVEYPVVAVPTNKVTVKYYDEELKFKNEETKVLENLNLKEDGYEYYFDEDFTIMLSNQDPDGNISEYEWEIILKEHKIDNIEELTIYARPERKITFKFIGVEEFEQFENLYKFPSAISMIRAYKNYDSATGTFTNEIKSIKDFENNSTVYITYPYVNVYAFGTEEGTQPLLLAEKYKTQILIDSLTTSEQERNIYKTKDITGEKYTAETLYNVDIGEPVYVAPEVLIDPVEIWETDPIYGGQIGHLTSDEKIYLADFYELLQKEDHQKYYKKEYQERIVYIEWTKAVFDGLAGDSLIWGGLEAYTSVPDTTQINVVDLNMELAGVDPNASVNERYVMNSEYKQDLVDKFETDYTGCKFYTNADKTGDPLTLDGIKALKDGDSIYKYSEIIEVCFVSTNGSLLSGQTMPKNQVYLQYKDATLYKDYLNYEGEKAEITIADVMALPETSDENPVIVYVVTTSLKAHIRHSNAGEEYTDSYNEFTVVSLINMYYGPSPFGTVYKTSEEKEAYTKEELLELEDGTEIWILEN